MMWRSALCTLVVGVGLSACVAAPVSTSTLTPAASVPAAVSPSPVASAPTQIDPADAVSRRLLAYHDQLRQMSHAEAAQEITRLNATIATNPTAVSPSTALELALALVQNRANADVPRALSVLDPIVRSNAAELAPWQPLARLLAARLADQRRLEEQLDRQTSALRETQRNLLQTSEKLEALKAIERSLNAKPR